MIRSEYMAIKPGFLSKYAHRYDSAMALPEIQAGLAERILREAKEDIDDQFSHVFRIEGDTAIINLFGPMSEDGPDWIDLYYGYNGVAYKNLIRASEEIMKSDKVKNVIVNGNTPGGNIDGLDAATQALMMVADKFPVTAINRGQIASAGVWYTSAAHKVIASSPSDMIGSIGVVIDTLDFTGYYDSFGVKQIVITNTDSPNKRPDLLTEDGKNIYVKQLDSLFGVFLDRVTTGRSVKPESIKALKGEMIIAADAVKIGLMTGIEGSTVQADPAGSTTNQTAEIQTEKELTMEDDVKAAFEEMAKSVSAIGKKVDAMTGTTQQTLTVEEIKKELSAEDKTFCKNIITGGKYPVVITGLATDVLSGEKEYSALIASVAAVDAVKEQNAGAGAAAAGTAAGDTIPDGKLPGTETKKDGNIDTDADVKAELDRIKGEA